MSNQQKDPRNIQNELVTNHLNRLFKKNSKAIALLLKALIKGEKLYPKDTLLKPIKENPLETSQTNNPTQLRILKPQTKAKSPAKPPTKSPLNIEG